MKEIKRPVLSGVLAIVLMGCSSSQSAIVEHFCPEAIEVSVVWAFGELESDRFDQATTLVEPGVPTTVWEACCDPHPDGTIELSTGDWFYVDEATDYDDSVIMIGEEGCV
ncbi:MAG: hypothetical protein R8J94_19195 [Acidimicrobiia bacterium]|nr:hypothetical protein [Acidimicrobiia bacterium]